MSAEPVYRTPTWTALWLGIGFAVLVGIGIVTVLVPELEDKPAEETPTSQKD